MRMWYSGFRFLWQYHPVLLFLLWEGRNCQEQTEAVPGFKIKAPAEVTVQRGLCVLIPCNFTVGPAFTLTKNAIGIWYKGYNGYYGYHYGPVAASTDSSRFPDTTNGRFIFTGKVSAGDCSFSISDAQPGDTDQYHFRLEDKDSLKITYFGIKPSVSVTDLKEPDISATKYLIADEEVTVTCTAPTHCPGLSPTFTWEGSVNTENTQNNTLWHQDGTVTYWSTITFTPSLRHHNSSLTCTVTYKHESATTSITLNVIWFKIEAPAEVTVQRGLCVLIPCNFIIGPDYNLTKDAIGIWYKGYNGYKSDPVAASTDSSQFPDTTNGRFIFTGKVSAGDCSFSISDAQPGDTDQYHFRLEDRDNLRFTFLNIQPTVSVTDPKETCLDSKVIPAMVAGNIFILALMGLGGFWYLKRTRKMPEKGETRKGPKPKAEESTYETLKTQSQDTYSTLNLPTISKTH